MPEGWLCISLFRQQLISYFISYFSFLISFCYNFLARGFFPGPWHGSSRRLSAAMWKYNFAWSNNFSVLIWCELMPMGELGVLVALYLKLLERLSLWPWSPSTPNCVFLTLLHVVQAFIWVSRGLAQRVKPAIVCLGLLHWPCRPELSLMWCFCTQAGSWFTQLNMRSVCVVSSTGWNDSLPEYLFWFLHCLWPCSSFSPRVLSSAQ